MPALPRNPASVRRRQPIKPAPLPVPWLRGSAPAAQGLCHWHSMLPTAGVQLQFGMECRCGCPWSLNVLGRCKVRSCSNMASTPLDWPWPSVVVSQRTWWLCAQYPTVQQGACPMAATGTIFLLFRWVAVMELRGSSPCFPPPRSHDNETLAMAGSSLATSRLGGGSPDSF